jgi:sugar O-acyltransferase (sialic acid O-acetyltransferase NeuD family)
MPTELLYLLGAGGHAKVVIDALHEMQFDMRQVRLRDDAVARRGDDILGLEIDAPAIIASMSGSRYHLAIGSCTARLQLSGKLEALGMRALAIIHPASVISRHAQIADGAFIAARAIIGPTARIGKSVIVNHGAVVDHDCVVGDFSHIAPNATLAGNVRIGAGVLIGAGANILPGVEIGDEAVIGAGAVVVSNVDAGQVQVGIPAKKLKGK